MYRLNGTLHGQKTAAGVKKQHSTNTVPVVICSSGQLSASFRANNADLRFIEFTPSFTIKYAAGFLLLLFLLLLFLLCHVCMITLNIGQLWKTGFLESNKTDQIKNPLFIIPSFFTYQ